MKYRVRLFLSRIDTFRSIFDVCAFGFKIKLSSFEKFYLLSIVVLIVKCISFFIVKEFFFIIFAELVFLVLFVSGAFFWCSCFGSNLRNFKKIGYSDSDNFEFYKRLFDSIEDVVLRDKLYLRARFKMLEMSEITGLSVRDISRAINICSGMCFNDFINKLRVNEVVRKFENDDVPLGGIYEIAKSCGFGSKTTFNSAFKKFVGVTPSNYKEMTKKKGRSEFSD